MPQNQSKREVGQIGILIISDYLLVSERFRGLGFGDGIESFSTHMNDLPCTVYIISTLKNQCGPAVQSFSPRHPANHCAYLY